MDALDRARTRDTAPSPAQVRRLSLALVATLTLVAAFLLPSTAAGGAETSGTSAVAAATVPVSMDDDFFSPANVSITAGDTVVWTNNGTDEHTASSTTNAFFSPTMGPGDRYQHTFNTAGTYNYVCAFHDDMRGTVTVTGGTTSPPRPTVRLVAFGPNPFRLAGTGRLRATYAVGQPSRLVARIVSVATGRAVYAYANRRTTRATRVTYYWNGTNAQRRNVRPGRYRFVLNVYDRLNRRVVSRKEFRVVR